MPVVVNAVRPHLVRMASAYVTAEKINNLSNEAQGFAQKIQEQWQEDKSLEDIEIGEDIKGGLKEIELKDTDSEPDAAIDKDEAEGKEVTDVEIPQNVLDGLRGIEHDGQDLEAKDRTFVDGIKDKSINEDSGKARGIDMGDQGKLENADSIIGDRENGTTEDKINEILKTGNRWGDYDYAENKSENLEMEIYNQEPELSVEQEQGFLEVAQGTNFNFYNTDLEPPQEIDTTTSNYEIQITEEQEKNFIELIQVDNFSNNYSILNPEPEISNIETNDDSFDMDMDADGGDGGDGGGDGGE